MNSNQFSSPPWPWPDFFDALSAAPRHHFLLFENDRVRVLRTRIGPGETVPVHTHRWPALLYVEAFSDHIRRDAEGEILFDSRKSAADPALRAVQWSDPLPPHSLENIGASEISVLSVELKNS